MSPGDQEPVDGPEEQNGRTRGNSSVGSSEEEILSAPDRVRTGTTRDDLISTQPGASSAESSQDDLQNPTGPRCGLAVTDQTRPSASPGLSPQQNQASSLSVHGGSSKRKRRKRADASGSHQSTASPAGSCFGLLMACLSCQASVLLLGLLEASSSCLLGLCSSCCHACALCCQAVREAPVEELNCHAHCHSVLFESCCEPTECLEFCLECCDICHRS